MISMEALCTIGMNHATSLDYTTYAWGHGEGYYVFGQGYGDQTGSGSGGGWGWCLNEGYTKEWLTLELEFFRLVFE